MLALRYPLRQGQIKGDQMLAVSVTVIVKPDRVDEFIRATLDNAKNSRLEPGNVRFDVLQAEDNRARFLLYEVYQSPDGFKEHQQTAHYARWKQAVADQMAEPRQAVKLNALFFGDAACAEG
jgi:autoinducer 2-degrading protein